MSCCNNTYNLGCYDSCSNLSIGVAEVSGTYKGIFTSGNNRITQTITVISGQPFVFDLRKLNESATYSLSIYRNGVQQEITIDDVQYDCFSFKTQILGLDNSVTPIQGCTPFCQEIGIFTDETLSGKGTELNPLSVVGGDGGVEVDGTTIIGDGITTPLSAIFNQTGKYIINGGASWSGTGLVYDVSILNYFFNGIKPTTQAQVTLDASDATYDRFDAIVVDEDGVVSVIKGTADINQLTPTIPYDQLLVQYVLVGAGTLTPAITQEIVHSDEPTTNWTASNYTTAGGVVGTTDFAATTPTPFQGADCILNTRDGRTGVRFVRDTAINLADYTYVALRVFIPTALATNKSLVLRFENSAGVLIGTGINLFSYGINRNLIGVWQMAYVPTYAFGAINSIKGLKIILSGGTVGVTAQWAIDYVLLSTGSTPSANLPTITVSENGVSKGNTENINFIDGTNTTVDVVKDLITGKIDVKVNALGGSSSLFPNGIKVVTSSRDLQADDKDFVLLCIGTNIILSMPEVNPFTEGDYIGFIASDMDSYIEGYNSGVSTDKYKALPTTATTNAEVVIIRCINEGGILKNISLNGAVREIGTSDFKTTLRYLYDKVNASGGGGDIFITKTKAEIDALISTNALVKGATYKITGVHPTLYNDGTNSGTTILLKAISENVLETQGTGIFYNPKYNQAVAGFGIWDNKMYGTFNTIVGTFDYQNKETVTADNGATGILLADGMIQYVSGNWSSAISITGGTSSATANVADFVSPSYAVNDKVIWGGYSWTNVNGNIGASTDVLNLDSEWIKDVYDTTNYNIAYDVIEYDYANDWISRRYEIASNVDVKITKSNFDLLVNNYGLIYSSISVQQFGNPFDFNIVKGIFNKSINNAYDESINFSGSIQYNLTFGQSSCQHNITFGRNSKQQNLTFGQNSFQQNLTFGQYSFQQNLTFGAGSSQQYLTFGQNSFQQYLNFGQDSYQNNLTFGQNSYQFNLTFGQNSQVDFNNQTLNSNMEYIDFKTKNITVPDLSSATYIFDGNVKEVYQRPDGTIKLKFMNNSDVLEVHGIAD